MTLRHSAKDSFDTLAIFIDYHNLEGSLRNEGGRTDILSIRDYLTEGRRLIETFIYIGLNPNNVDEDLRIHRTLRRNGFLVRSKLAKVRPDGSLKCDLDIEMVLDVIDFIHRAKPGIVLLVTGDGDFLPLIGWLRLRGVRVEVASTPGSISQDLREAAGGYIDLIQAIEEIEMAKREYSRREENKNGNDFNSAAPTGRDSIHCEG